MSLPFAPSIFLLAVGALACAIVAALAVRRGRARDGVLLDIVIDNMTQGVVLVDADEIVHVCNRRYVEMYGLSPEIVKPGCTLRDLIRNRISTGSLNIDPEKYRAEILASVQRNEAMNRIVETPDGRAVSVINRPVDGGKYWIGTHDDITDRIQAERKSAALGEQERRRVTIEMEIRDFRESVAAMLRTVGDGAAALEAIAVALSHSSGDTLARATGAVRSSDEASANMTAAAGAAEELIASIVEIGRQIGQAADLVALAVTEANATDDRMNGLSAAVQEIGDGVWLEPAFGHSPGSCLVRAQAGGAQALFWGDTIHHPIQLVRPELTLPFDFDQQRAAKVRQDVLERIADTDTMCFPAHFRGQTAGHVHRDGDAYRYAFVEG